MILQELCNYYDIISANNNVEIPRYGYITAPIHFVLEIAQDGKLKNIVDKRSNGKKPQPEMMVVPFQKSRSSDIRPFFVRDNIKYVFGIEKKQKEDKKIAKDKNQTEFIASADSKKRFEAFKELHQEILKDQTDPEVHAFLRFLDAWKPELFFENLFIQENIAQFENNTNFVFRCGADYLHKNPVVKRLWEIYHSKTSQENDRRIGQCLISGKTEQIANIHYQINVDPKNKAPLVSFNDESFCSYGQKQGYNAPVGKISAFKYSTALNYLLRPNSENRIRLGDTVLVFWADTTENCEDLINGLINYSYQQPNKKTVKIDSESKSVSDYDTEQLIDDVFKKVKTGKLLEEKTLGIDLNTTNFYILGLSPNKGRTIVQFWYQDSFGNFITHMARHHLDMEIGDRGPMNISFFRLLLATLPSKKGNKSHIKKGDNQDSDFSETQLKKIHPLLEDSLIRAILTNRQYPIQMYTSILNRVKIPRSDDKKSPDNVQAGFIKAYLLRMSRAGLTNLKEDLITVSLNEESTNVPYRLGRLFAVFEKTQKQANPKIERTIQDSYFSSASSSPAIVFTILMKLNQHHLSKIKSEKPGLAVYYSRLRDDIVSSIEKIPAFLSLEEQGMFMLGYYHQRNFRKADENDQISEEEKP